MAGSLAPLPGLPSLFDPQRQQITPESIKRRRALADALAEQSVRPDAGSLLGAIGKGLQGFTAAVQRDRADKEERGAQDEIAALLARAAQGGGAPAAAGIPASGQAAPTQAPMAGPGLTRNPSAGMAGGGSTSAKAVFDGLISRGVPSIVAAGMVGNIAGESNFRLGVADGRGEGSVGLIQARGDRLASLRSLGASTGRDPFSLDNQLDHIVSEFNGPEKAAFQRAQTAKTPGEAAYILAKHYERPADWALQESAPKRMGAAEQAYRQFGQRADAGPAAQADMPVQNAQDASFLTGDRDPNGGFFIPPAVRVTAPAGNPSGPLPGDAPAPPVSPDIAALLSTTPMGPAQSFVPQGGPMPQPAPPDAAPAVAPQQVAQAPAIPSMVGAPAPVSYPEIPGNSPAMPAPSPAPMTVPLPPQRPSDAALAVAPPAPNPADLPAPNAVPVAGNLGIDPNSPDAGAGVFARRQGVDRLLGGLQDGLDRIFGGPETQARLDRQVAALGGAPQASPRALQLARQLDPAAAAPAAGGAPAASAPATAGASPSVLATVLGGGQQPDPRALRQAAILDPASAQAASSPVQGGGGGMPTAAPTNGQGSGLTDARRAELLAVANHPFATPQVRQFAIDQLNPKLTHVDMGDSIGFTDPGGNLVRSYAKTKAADYGEVGRDAYGQPIMGYRNYGNQSVTVPQVPGSTAGQAPVDMNGRPVPQGVDPKLVRETQSKSYAEGTVPASDANVAELRKEVAQRPEFKNYAQAVPVYRAMTDAAGRDTKASDLNLIYGLGKIMDPGSVVREGELKMANDTQGVSDKLIGMWNAVNGGARLTPQSRASLMAEAYGRMQAFEGEYGAVRSHYTDIAKRNRMNPDDVVQGIEPVKPWQADGGTVSVTSPEDARKLKPGTRFRTPDGREFTR